MTPATRSVALVGTGTMGLAMTEAVRRHLATAADLGHGSEDMAATYYAHQRGSAT